MSGQCRLPSPQSRASPWLFKVGPRTFGASGARCALRKGEIGRAFAAIAAGLDLERHLLSVRKAGQAGPFDGGDVDENVLTARIRLDEAEAFLGIEKLHGAVRHVRGLLFIRCPQDAAARQSQTERSTEAG